MIDCSKLLEWRKTKNCVYPVSHVCDHLWFWALKTSKDGKKILEKNHLI